MFYLGLALSGFVVFLTCVFISILEVKNEKNNTIDR